ncbi:helix-turn-helix domain-containing protein [Gluconobacter sp. NFX36]|uniref:YdaS family helix-turn-helix protein n=1 Tax=Gluconobacter TaxID=441 RepID=UPI00078162FF|nr:YdaS family helix-turn-helix protein [Gluconobacter japonicus]KXV20624.1 hypothetical protein AD935_11090 [Gluconobacter japonicus]MBS1050508.1 helix-turn-helix domain-containing protein [Gluconobacter japonicus]
MTDLPITEARSIIADAVEMAGGQHALARRLGITQSDISQAVNNGRTDSRKRVLNALGYVVIETIRPMRGQNR